MLLYAVLIFAVAAIGGLVLASSVLRGKLAPWAISVLHALLGASGLVLLILILYRAYRGQFSRQHHVAVAAVTLYWHFVDVVWLFLFGILYLGVTFFQSNP